jgi:hypothetical protein
MIRYNEYPNIFGIIGSCLIFIGLVGVIIKWYIGKNDINIYWCIFKNKK